MYNNETYEEYIRSILGYPNYNNNHFEEAQYYPINYLNDYSNYEQNTELEGCYPEIYKIVYPMISKACMTNTKPVNSKLVDELTEEIYRSIETENEVKININLNNQTSSSVNNRSTPTSNIKKESTSEKRGDDRGPKNNSLRDLIRILLIRELLGNRPNRPNNRPPFPGGSGFRPPFPPNQPDNQQRPPIMPRTLY